MRETTEVEVAIVGYGPTGATLANLLGSVGISVIVIDRESSFYPLPRAVHFDDETMRVFQTVGISDELRKCIRVNLGMRFQDDQGRLLLDWPRDQSITQQGWHASYRLHQPDLERLLRAGVSKLDNVTDMPGCEIQSIIENEGHIELAGRNLSTNKTVFVKAQYVVGCDGANSLVRSYIGGDMDDLGFNERWLVVDLLLKRQRPDLGDHSIQFCSATRPMTYCRNPGDRRRWEMAILAGERDEDISENSNVWKLLSRWITPEDATIERSAIYTFKSALAFRWRKGRALIAGDAAHLTPPFMGQGMCTGIRDVSNLAWKLKAVIRQQFDSSLLDSYQAERAPHARAYIETAISLGGLINSLDQKSALQMAQRRAAGNATIKSIQPKLGPSAVMYSEPEHDKDPVGRPAAQPIIARAQCKLDDIVGYKHLFVSREACDADNLDKEIISMSADQYPELNSLLDQLGTNAVWIRPDRYVAAISQSSEDLITTHSVLKAKTTLFRK